MAAWVDKASKSAPAGSDVAVNAFKSTIAATTAAFDQFQKASKQVVSLADANVRAAAANATKAVKGKQGRVNQAPLGNAPVLLPTGARTLTEIGNGRLEKSPPVPTSVVMSPSVSISSS